MTESGGGAHLVVVAVQASTHCVGERARLPALRVVAARPTVLQHAQQRGLAGPIVAVALRPQRPHQTAALRRLVGGRVRAPRAWPPR